MTSIEVKANFENLCGDILLGKATEENIKKVTKQMSDTNQCDYMKQKFTRIGEILKKWIK